MSLNVITKKSFKLFRTLPGLIEMTDSSLWKERSLKYIVILRRQRSYQRSVGTFPRSQESNQRHILRPQMIDYKKVGEIICTGLIHIKYLKIHEFIHAAGEKYLIHHHWRLLRYQFNTPKFDKIEKNLTFTLPLMYRSDFKVIKRLLQGNSSL